MNRHADELERTLLPEATRLCQGKEMIRTETMVEGHNGAAESWLRNEGQNFRVVFP